MFDVATRTKSVSSNDTARTPTAGRSLPTRLHHRDWIKAEPATTPNTIRALFRKMDIAVFTLGSTPANGKSSPRRVGSAAVTRTRTATVATDATIHPAIDAVSAATACRRLICERLRESPAVRPA